MNWYSAFGMIVSPCSMDYIAGIANGEGKNLIEKTLIEYSKSEYYPEKVKQNLTEFMSSTKNRIYILHTHLKFLEENTSITNSQHGYFMDLFQDEKIVRESYFYIIDYESHDKLFKEHKEPDEPKIHYYYKRLLISDNLYHQDKHKSEVKNEDKTLKLNAIFK